jgi:hypothetical protein
MFDTPKTNAMKAFLAREANRVTGLSLEGADGVFIYTTSAEWCDDNGSGTFHGDTETGAIKAFYARVRKAEAAAPAPVATQHGSSNVKNSKAINASPESVVAGLCKGDVLLKTFRFVWRVETNGDWYEQNVIAVNSDAAQDQWCDFWELSGPDLAHFEFAEVQGEPAALDREPLVEMDTVPAHHAIVYDADKNVVNRHQVKWGNRLAPPAIGAGVWCVVNGIGPCTVTGYYTEGGYLGITARPLTPPAWLVKQGGGDKVYLFGVEFRVDRAIHKFESTGNAYDACQCDEDIKNGDILVIASEGVIGIADTWPFAVTAEAGSLHTVKEGVEMEHLKETGKYDRFDMHQLRGVAAELEIELAPAYRA